VPQSPLAARHFGAASGLPSTLGTKSQEKTMKFAKRFFSLLAVVLALGLGSGAAQAAPFDQQFIDSMTPHHQSALMMAQMAVKQAHYPEVRRLARGIIGDQKKEIAQMKAWRKAWYGSAAAPMAGMNHGAMNHSMNGSMSGMKMSGDKMMMPGEMMGLPMKGEMDMGKLKNAKGRDFDRMFLQMMIPHHAGAVMMADEALKVTARPQLRKMSHAIISSQAREIGLMQSILDRRFGR